MKGYVIAEIEIIDQKTYDEYRAQVLPTVERYGGRFLVRGGKAEALEGSAPGRVVVLEFASYDAAAAWYRSAEYSPLAALRQSATRGRLILVEGA
ncbi:hypothetical protein GCM10011611_01250 [Aliidongia dinghuensis]|uniref:DUF1330 domain-containing protein n=1 Tax=Aliidongia dinghuensis TaxID=1867774 RepID=A0A8J2YP30_9PROT|nr:DUF1330 domain-containing protein [Aliidongia dinghuensis]GGE99419.1 hypothetical protein GCM10011611_01250 [Aliidongia dinghuensis]